MIKMYSVCLWVEGHVHTGYPFIVVTMSRYGERFPNHGRPMMS